MSAKFEPGDRVRLTITCCARRDNRQSHFTMLSTKFTRLTAGSVFTVVIKSQNDPTSGDTPAYACRDEQGRRWRIAESLLELAPATPVEPTNTQE